MLVYDKCKDTSPENTISKLKSIFQQMELDTEVAWMPSEYSHAYSNRIQLSPTSLGTNGKGTDEAYALASGYAELVERIENGTILIGYQSPKLIESFGFVYCPDEVKISLAVLAEQNDPFTNYIFNFYHATTVEEKVACLRKLPRLSTSDYDENAMVCTPFAYVQQNRIVYIPLEIMLPIYGSNGMAAGNTMEEALVQGISEILERYANRAILDGTVPPEIPREYWKQSPVSALIAEIEQSGRYRVSVLDCSLGKSIPATAVVISDLETGNFGIHFSCHPSFDVSVERTLTEALQGKNLESFTKMNRIGDEQMCHCVDNYPNLMKIGLGAYPIDLFAGEPSYSFSPRDEWKGLTNREMLVKLLRIIRNEGFEVLVRDASHLGFPAYHILVPGMSEMFFSDGRRIKELHTVNRVVSSMKHFPDLNPAEEDRLMLLLRYKEYSALENQFGWITTLPLVGNLFAVERVRAYLHFKRKEFDEAYAWFQNLASQDDYKAERTFYLCAAEYTRLLLIGATAEQAFAILKQYFPEQTAVAVFDQLCEPDLVMKKVFRPFTCDRCELCPHANTNCEYPEIERVMFKIKKALSQSVVSQGQVLQQLSELTS